MTIDQDKMTTINDHLLKLSVRLEKRKGLAL